MIGSFEQFRPTQAVIHLDHLRKNFDSLHKLNGASSFFCPMIKANAYGHGDLEVARVLESCQTQAMGVGLIEEGSWLRGQGIRTELLFFGLMDQSGAEACLESSLTPVLSSWVQTHDLLLAMKARKISNVRVHLKFDTGMSRLGFEASESDRLVDFFQDHPELCLAGVMTHLHSGEDADDVRGHSFLQLRQFQNLAKKFSKWSPTWHALNSAGLLNFAKLKHAGQEELEGVSLKQGSRPGLALYGLSPLNDLQMKDMNLNLLPVMSLRSKIIRVKKIPAGQGVSYSHSWKASRDSWIGVIPIGYADGFHRHLSNRGSVLCEGQRVPIVGNICMDYFMVDLTHLAGAGGAESLQSSEVTLFGQDVQGRKLSAHEVAKAADTIVWEILTSVGERVPRVLEGK